MSTIGYYICVPFSWLVRLFYELTGSYGVAIILFTLVLKLIMLPFQLKSKKSMLRMSRLSSKTQEIQKKYANNQQKANEEIQRLYQEEGINPMTGCLWTLIPLPIMIALYSIIRQPITHFMMLSQEVVTKLVTAAAAAGLDISGIATLKDNAYSLTAYGQINLVKMAGENLQSVTAGIDGWFDVNYNFIGLDLAATPWHSITGFVFSWGAIGLILIPLLAGGTQFILSKITAKTQQGAANASMKSMTYMMPLMSVYIAFIMPAALGIYWIAQSLFSLVQEIILNKFFGEKLSAEELAAEEARRLDRERRMEEGRKQQELLRAQEQKLTLKEKQRAAQEAKLAKAAKSGSSTSEAGRVGDRPYARGRAYKADRYEGKE